MSRARRPSSNHCPSAAGGSCLSVNRRLLTNRRWGSAVECHVFWRSVAEAFCRCPSPARRTSICRTRRWPASPSSAGCPPLSPRYAPTVRTMRCGGCGVLRRGCGALGVGAATESWGRPSHDRPAALAPVHFRTLKYAHARARALRATGPPRAQGQEVEETEIAGVQRWQRVGRALFLHTGLSPGPLLSLGLLLTTRHHSRTRTRTRKRSEAGCGRPEDGCVGTATTVKRPPQQPAQPQYANYWAPLTRNGTSCHIQHSPNTPTIGLCECGNDTSKSTGRSGRQKAATRRNMRREERVTVQGPVKKQ